jgi:hypothetical protein
MITDFKSKIYDLSKELQQKYGDFTNLPSGLVLNACIILDCYKQWSIIKRIGTRVPKERWRKGHTYADVILADIIDSFGSDAKK